VEDDDITDPEYNEAAGSFQDHRSQGVLLFLEMVELDFDELMASEGVVEGGEEWLGDAGLADFKDRFEALGLRLEAAKLRA
jgi:hypothetical protein